MLSRVAPHPEAVELCSCCHWTDADVCHYYCGMYEVVECRFASGVVVTGVLHDTVEADDQRQRNLVADPQNSFAVRVRNHWSLVAALDLSWLVEEQSDEQDLLDALTAGCFAAHENMQHHCEVAYLEVTSDYGAVGGALANVRYADEVVPHVVLCCVRLKVAGGLATVRNQLCQGAASLAIRFSWMPLLSFWMGK